MCDLIRQGVGEGVCEEWVRDGSRSGWVGWVDGWVFIEYNILYRVKDSIARNGWADGGLITYFNMYIFPILL